MKILIEVEERENGKSTVRADRLPADYVEIAVFRVGHVASVAGVDLTRALRAFTVGFLEGCDTHDNA